MKAFYCDTFVLPLPAGHRFPMQKYARLRQRVRNELPQVELTIPQAASNAMLERVHTKAYIRAMETGELDAAAQKRLGFPWSLAMIERARRSVGATVAALEAAVQFRVGANLAGGTHHAFADHGEGFCCFNDVAVAIRHGQAHGLLERALVVDLDVHQGNGTAAIFESDPSVFTLSLHGEANYPVNKERSDLDVGLPSGCDDEAYLAALNEALDVCERAGPFDVLFYVAGADVYRGDRLGQLKLTQEGIAKRDQRVFSFARQHGLPVVITMGGGYCPNLDEIVEIHFTTLRLACA
jgi:acetoin utilization deacetylase AcuC-like enzyme